MQIRKGSMLANCMELGKSGKKHKGLEKVEPNPAQAREHLQKARHNLEFLEYAIQGKFTDWAITIAFYVQYHCLTAILFHLGWKSQSQRCTFAAIKELIKANEIDLTEEDLKKILPTDEAEPQSLVDWREDMQYGIKLSAEKDLVGKLKKDSLELIEKVNMIIAE